jgi:hypothetical protein
MHIRSVHRRRHVWLLSLALTAVILSPAGWLPAQAQGKRTVIPQGFEYPADTPRIRYHYPRGSTKPAVMTGTWIAENVENVKPDFQIDVATVKVTNEPITNFSLTNSKGKWPQGVYRLEIRSDGQLVHTARFTVR